MTKKIEFTILAAFVGLLYVILKFALPDFPGTEQALLALFLYVLAKLGVEVVGKPVLKRLFPKQFMGTRYVTPES